MKEGSVEVGGLNERRANVYLCRRHIETGSDGRSSRDIAHRLITTGSPAVKQAVSGVVTVIELGPAGDEPLLVQDTKIE